MKSIILQVDQLSVQYTVGENIAMALDNISFSLEKGGSLGIIGESGSGKTTTAMALMGLLEKSAVIHGNIRYCDKNLHNLSEREWNEYRWCKIAIIFQNSMEVLNPVLTIGEQISECLKRHTELDLGATNRKVERLLKNVGLELLWKNYYPHQLSGGMRQRVLVAMALSCDPEVLIVDEPTNALDAVTKKEITELLAKLHKENKFGLIVISHEVSTVAQLVSRLVVLYKGCIVEEGQTKDILNNPLHNYTRGLLNSSPDMNPYRDLWGIPGDSGDKQDKGCPFYSRCNQHIDSCISHKPRLEHVCIERKVACNRKGIVTLLQGSGISKAYEFKGNFQKACDNCCLEIRAGEVVALIGQSGSGKTTLASILAGVLAADNGEVLFQGKTMCLNSMTGKKKGIQIIFQDPYSSINEQLTVEQAVREPLDILRDGASVEKKLEIVSAALKNVQLPGDEQSFLKRRCHTLSGGQRQRVAVARALVMEPILLIADEISSMLDPSTQANILRLLKGLQNIKGFAMLYITHDLIVAQKIADKVCVMQQGKIIEKGNASDVFIRPTQNYTKRLVKEGLRGYQLEWR